MYIYIYITLPAPSQYIDVVGCWGFTSCQNDSAYPWRFYSAVPLGDQAASTMTWYSSQYHCLSTEPTRLSHILIKPNDGDGCDDGAGSYDGYGDGRRGDGGNSYAGGSDDIDADGGGDRDNDGDGDGVNGDDHYHGHGFNGDDDDDDNGAFNDGNYGNVGNNDNDYCPNYVNENERREGMRLKLGDAIQSLLYIKFIHVRLCLFVVVLRPSNI